MIPAFTRHRAASSGFVLDLLSVSAAAAYGLRRLRSGYTGPAINVRRSSDNTTQDIGFTSGALLDTTALLAFVGSGNGYIAIWYDQGPNAAHASQSTAGSQPMIVSAGAVVLQNSVPTLKFYNGGISVLKATLNAFSAGYALNAVVANTGSQAYAAIADKTTTGGVAAPWMFFGQSGAWDRWYIGNGSSQNNTAFSVTDTALSIITHECLQSTLAASLFNNGSQIISQTYYAYADSTNQITIGARGDNATWLDGPLPELTLFSAPLTTTDRHTLERNQGTYFGVSVA